MQQKFYCDNLKLEQQQQVTITKTINSTLKFR